MTKRNGGYRNNIYVRPGVQGINFFLMAIQSILLLAISYFFVRHYSYSDEKQLHIWALIFIFSALIIAVIRRYILKKNSINSLASKSKVKSRVTFWMSIFWLSEILVYAIFFFSLFVGVFLNYKPL